MEVVLEHNVGTPMNAVNRAWEFSAFNARPGFSYPHNSVNVALTVEGVFGDMFIQELGQLKDDWDGYGAAQIGPEIICQARDAYAFFCRTGSAPAPR